MVDGYVILDAKGADVNDITTGISIPGSHELLASAFTSGRSVIVVGLVSNDTPLAPTVARVEKNEDDYILSGFSAKVTPEGRLVPVREGPYTLPIATSTTLGGIKVGDGLEIDENGVLKVQSTEPPAPYELPTASSSTLGGIKVGDSLSIDNGVLDTPVKLGFDTESGKYGYYKAGESVITPFEEGGGGDNFVVPIFDQMTPVYTSGGIVYMNAASSGNNCHTYLWYVEPGSTYIVFCGAIAGNRFRLSEMPNNWSVDLPTPGSSTQTISSNGRNVKDITTPTNENTVCKVVNSVYPYVTLTITNQSDPIPKAYLIKI